VKRKTLDHEKIVSDFLSGYSVSDIVWEIYQVNEFDPEHWKYLIRVEKVLRRALIRESKARKR
jgi:hypothetical protein